MEEEEEGGAGVQPVQIFPANAILNNVTFSQITHKGMAKADLSIKLAAPPPPLLYSHFPFLHFDNRLSPFSNESSVFREQSWTGFLDTLGRVG